MNLYTFLEKNFGDQNSNPLPAYYARTTDQVVESLTIPESLKERTKKPTLIPKLTFNDWTVPTDEFLKDTDSINNYRKTLDSILYGIEDENNVPLTDENKARIKNAAKQFIEWVNLRKFPNGYLVDKNGNLDINNEFLKKFYTEEVVNFIKENGGSSTQSDNDDQQGSGSDGTGFVDFLRSLQLLEHSIKNYTRLYMESSNRGIRTLLEAAFTEQQIKDIFEKQENLTKLLDLGTPEQINYVMYKIIEDLPDSSISKNLEEKIIGNKNASEGIFINMIKVGMQLQGISLNDDQLKKLYQAVTLPPPTSIPQGLETFGKPGGVGAYISPGGGSSVPPPITPQPQPSTQDDTPAATTPGVDPTDKELEIYRRVYNANYDPNSPQDRANLEQIRKNAYNTDGDIDDPQVYRAQKRQQSLQPIENRYVRTGFNQFRPAVKADEEVGTPLFMQNPNPVYREFNPYVQVDRYEAKRNKQPKPDFSKQRVSPPGARIEADGSIRRKSKLKGAAGSLSNFLGDVGNTLKGN